MNNGNVTYSGGIVIESESVKKLGTDIRTKTEELLSMIRIAEEKLNSSASYYNSASATEFRTKMKTFTTNAEDKSKKTLETVAAFFERVAKQYQTIDQDIMDLEKTYLTDDSSFFQATE